MMANHLTLLFTLCLIGRLIVNVHSLTKSEQELLIDKVTNFINKLDHSAENQVQIRSFFEELFMLDIDPTCRSELLKWIFSIVGFELWSFNVLDTFGKPPSGLILGGLSMVGEYRQCKLISHPYINDEGNMTTWDGNYCMFSRGLYIDMFPIQVRYGLCVPNSCNASDVSKVINIGLNSLVPTVDGLLANFGLQFSLASLNLSSTEKDFECLESIPLDDEAIASISVLSIFGFLVAVATLIDAFLRLYKHFKSPSPVEPHEPAVTKVERFEIEDGYIEEHQTNTSRAGFIADIATSFSIIRSFGWIFETKKSSQDYLSILNGVLFISLAWIVLGYGAMELPFSVDNPRRAVDWFKDVPFQLVSNHFTAYDSIFFALGLLNAVYFFREVDKNGFGVVIFIKYYIDRLWSMTPVYMMVLAFSATLTKYLDVGPLYPKSGNEHDSCKDSWWSNLLYINNLLDWDGKPGRMCMPAVSWFFANLMQFYILAPLILIPFALRDKWFVYSIIGYLLSAWFALISILTAGLVFHYESDMTRQTEYPYLTESYFFKIHIKPWARCASFAIGTLFGYLVHSYKQQENESSKRSNVGKIVSILLYLISFTILGLVALGLHKNFVHGEEHAREINTVYEALSRTGWALALGFIVYESVVDKGLIYTILSHNIWSPVAKLTVPVILVYPIVVKFMFSVPEKPLHIQMSLILGSFFSNFGISVISALLAAILIQVPMNRFAQLIWNAILAD